MEPKIARTIRSTCLRLSVPELIRNIDIQWFNGKRAIGGMSGYSGQFVMRLSKYFWPILSEQQRKEVIIHEVCHAVAHYKYGCGIRHGKKWKDLMRQCKANPTRTMVI